MKEYEINLVETIQDQADYCRWIQNEIHTLAKTNLEAAKYNALNSIARLDRIPLQETKAFEDLLDDPIKYLDMITEDKNLENKLIEEMREITISGGW